MRGFHQRRAQAGTAWAPIRTDESYRNMALTLGDGGNEDGMMGRNDNDVAIYISYLPSTTYTLIVVGI